MHLFVQALKWSQAIWEGLPEATREELSALSLWERDSMVAFGREVKQGYVTAGPLVRLLLLGC